MSHPGKTQDGGGERGGPFHLGLGVVEPERRQIWK